MKFSLNAIGYPLFYQASINTFKTLKSTFSILWHDSNISLMRWSKVAWPSCGVHVKIARIGCCVNEMMHFVVISSDVQGR